MTNSKQSHGTKSLLGPEDVNKLKLIYLKFQMSCSKILKKMKLCLLKVSVRVNLSYLPFFFFSFPHFTLLPCIFEAAFFWPFSPAPPYPQDLCLSVEIIFFLDIGDPVSILQINFFLKNLCLSLEMIFFFF